MEIEKQIMDTAIANGADLAGIASMEALKNSASHIIYTQLPDYAGVGTSKDDHGQAREQLFNWPDTVKSVLVIGLSHPADKPELDWWDGRGTPGNRQLMEIMRLTRQQIESNLNGGTHKLHYYVEKGGVFLKDAAVLAGLGCIGKNNLLLTPSFGPRIRLRALFLDTELEPTGPVGFDPCSGCKVNCRRVCPEGAMKEKAPEFESIKAVAHLPARDGCYNRETCNIKMEKDIAESKKDNSKEPAPVKYCRRCEFVCPVGK
ncbi:MAG: epoxyqueuosine reductase [Thermodesulfobacteriota bacterium]